MNAIVSFRLCTLSDSELVKKVDQLTDEMYKTGKVPTRYIPARPNDDYDLLVGELVKRFHELTTKQPTEAQQSSLSTEQSPDSSPIKTEPMSEDLTDYYAARDEAVSEEMTEHEVGLEHKESLDNVFLAACYGDPINSVLYDSSIQDCAQAVYDRGATWRGSHPDKDLPKKP